MGTLYLVDAHNTVLLNSKIHDVVNLLAGDTQALRGSFPINVPFDVPIDGAPTDLNDLITKKYLGILAVYPGFNHILFDEQIDALDWLPTAFGSSFTLGSRQTNGVLGGTSDYLYSTTQVMASTPTVAVIRYEFFQYIESDPASGQYTRSYQDITTDPDIEVQVSFNNGNTFTNVSNGSVVNIPIGDQGNQFQIQFHRSSAGTPVNIGSWAVVY
jgi:hypothetical protein